MSEFVLVVLVTIGLTEQPTSFEVRLLKESYQQCIEDSKTYRFPFQELHKVISIETRCEKVLVEPEQKDKGTSV
tara:strand:- start:66 stop:287 length:222 start_codon:yes stop_codon:yes gene_type:complete